MRAFQDWAHEWAVEALRVAKPGAHILVFGGTRTYHRMTCAIEDAGWEIRDCVMWVYGSGFPKSHNLKDEWQGWGTALKPAWEPIIVARKPLIGTVAENVLKHGTGAMNIDGCRVGTEQVTINTFDDGMKPFGNGAGHAYSSKTVTGRWPANLVHDGSDEVMELFPEIKTGVCPADASHGYHGGFRRRGENKAANGGDSGSAARFFYCSKANKSDKGKDNIHPTVKPTDLMRYLCRLVTPPNGIVLDPFMGSGSTGKAALLEGFRFIGCEMNKDYMEIAERRIKEAADSKGLGDLFD
jgi:site-specific DNA-methyltransferase (adenine-specific)